VPPSVLDRPGRGISIAAFFFAATALWVYPVACGAAALGCAAYGTWRGDRLGRIALVVTVVCVVVGSAVQRLPDSFFS